MLACFWPQADLYLYHCLAKVCNYYYHIIMQQQYFTLRGHAACEFLCYFTIYLLIFTVLLLSSISSCQWRPRVKGLLLFWKTHTGTRPTCKIKLFAATSGAEKFKPTCKKTQKTADPLGVPCSYSCESVLTDKCPTCLQPDTETVLSLRIVSVFSCFF